MSATVPLRRPILADTVFLRLWLAGGVSGAAMWLEILAASVFVFEATRSGWAVALVSAARAAPLLLFGAVAGVVSDAWNRRSVVLGGLALCAGSAGAVALLARAGNIQPWHLGLAAFISGAAYATELPARRRMITESAGPARTDAAAAIDSLTSYAARCGGPVIGGLAFQHLGLAGTFAISGVSSAMMFALVLAVPYAQTVRRLSLRPFVTDLSTAVAFAARSPTLLGLLAVTVTMNLCGYSYTTLMTPVGLDALKLDSTWTGVLVAAEPGGAFCGGLLLTRFVPLGSRLGWLMGGVAILAAALLAAAGLAAGGSPFAVLCLAFAGGGFGSAIYTLNQTAIVMAETPPEVRSRVFGLVTMCIGSWPVGMLLAGGLARALPPLGALAALAALCLVLLGTVAIWRRRS